MDKKHIVVIEDEQHLAVGIKYNLEAEGYRVTTIGDGPKAVRYCEDNEADIDLIILDLMLPGMSGYAICEALRDAGFDMPVLILSARNMSEDRTRGFNVGANQYLTKPFDLDELLSRVKNLLTHYKRAPRASAAALSLKTYAFADFTIDFVEAQVKKGDQPITLTRRELELLRFFCENEGRLIPRAELIEKVWELPGHIQTRAPDQFLLRLRKIFEPDPANPRHFLTLRDLGYKFLSKPTEN
jgi:two-component system, OmpR family, alkaline phosphatase synthesis response regulator PhoP